MKIACEGVLYPQNAASCITLKQTSRAVLEEFSSRNVLHYVELKCKTHNLEGLLVPHKSWQYCKEELEAIFSCIKDKQNELKPLFVLAPLHKGPILTEEKTNNKIYCPQDGSLKGSDWEIMLETPQEIKPFVEQNDDVCTEEHSLEIIAPFIYKTFPRVPVCYLLASIDTEENTEEICEITSIIGRFYPNSIIFLSNNEETNCASMWKKD